MVWAPRFLRAGARRAPARTIEFRTLLCGLKLGLKVGLISLNAPLFLESNWYKRQNKQAFDLFSACPRERSLNHYEYKGKNLVE